MKTDSVNDIHKDCIIFHHQRKRGDNKKRYSSEDIKGMVERFENLKLENEKLQTRLDEAESVIDFYAKKENWTVDGHNHHDEIEFLENGEFSQTIRNDCDNSLPPEYFGTYAGRRAREYQQKYRSEK